MQLPLFYKCAIFIFVGLFVPEIVFAQSAGSVPYGFFSSKERVTPWGDVEPGYSGSSCFGSAYIYDIQKVAEDRFMVGGDFDSVRSSCTGSGVIVSTNTGEIESSFKADPVFPILGSVQTAASDGAGGWYVGGSFNNVGSFARNKVAHILADGSLDLSFVPELPKSGIVKTLAFDAANGRLHIGGSFEIIGPGRGAMFDTDSDIPKGGRFNNSVHASVSDGAGGWYVGGIFTQYDGYSAQRLAHINADGSLDKLFNIPCNGTVKSLYLDGSTLWIGGEFTTVNGIPRHNIASVSVVMGALFGDDIRLNGDVNAITKQASGVVIGGTFSHYNVDFYSYGAALSSADGSVLPMSAEVVSGSVSAAISDGSGGWYIGGGFSTVGGAARRSIAKLKSDGSLDTSWYPTGGATGGDINAMALDSSGRLYVGGLFSAIGGQSRKGIARLNANGSVDTSWYPAGGVTGYINALAVDSSDRLYVGGRFTAIGGQVRDNIARLNADGSVDTSWYPDGGTNYIWSFGIRALALDSSGRLYVGGSFSLIGGQARNNIARLNIDGSVDPSWNSVSSDYVNSLIVDSSDRLYVAGRFTTLGGQARNRIARLNMDGSVDASWYPDGGADAEVRSMALDSSGRLVIGGSFLVVGGRPRANVARVSADGSLDLSWVPPAISYSGGASNVLAVAVSNLGNVYAGGYFKSVGGESRGGIARLSADGSMDISWYPSGGTSGSVYALANDSSGQIYVGGDFTSVGGEFRNRVARLNADGSMDTSWYPSGGANGSVYALVKDSSGQIYVGGGFTSIGGESRNRIARLNADGSVDTSWYPSGGVVGTLVSTLALDSSDHLYIGGTFTSVGGQARSHIARLNPDASVDTSWYPIDGAANSIYTIALDDSNRVYVGGYFDRIGDIGRSNIIALDMLGKKLHWYPGGVTGSGASVSSLVLDSTGRLYVGGSFTGVGGQSRARIARLNADGSLDTSWYPTGGANNEISILALDNSDRLYVGGNFTSIGGQARNRIARVNTDGSIDTSWYPSGGANTYIYSIALDNSDRLYVGGSFVTIGAQTRNRIARLNPDGSVDTSWYPMGGADGSVLALAVDSLGRIYIGGSFSNIGGQSRETVARLNADSSVDSAWYPTGGANDSIAAFALNSSDHVYVGGGFTSIGIPSFSRNNLAVVDTLGRLTTWRLDADYDVTSIHLRSGKAVISGWFESVGELERIGIAEVSSKMKVSSWYPPGGTDYDTIYAMVSDGIGGLYVGGQFSTIGGQPREMIARLKADGSVDTSWYPAGGADGYIEAMAMDSLGRLYVGGWFSNIGGQPREYLARLNADGSVDTSWNVELNNGATSIAIDSSDRIYVGGYFSTVAGQSRNRIVRLNTDGSVDTSWYPPDGSENGIESVALDAAGRVYLGGYFTRGGAERWGLARFNADGSVDTSWNPGGGDYVEKVTVDSSGFVYVGGGFSSFGGKSREGLAIINPSGQVQ